MLVFDLETDGFYFDCTQIHCLAIYDSESKDTIAYNDTGSSEPIVRGIERLEDADLIVGHNIVGFDIPVISKLYPFFSRSTGVLDTLLLSRLFHPNIIDIDQKRKFKHMPLQLYGRHSLESYGYRLGVYKGCFGKTSDWKEWSQEMQDYCIQDVAVTTKLCAHFYPYLNGSN